MEHLTFRQLSVHHILIIIGDDLVNNRVLDTFGLQHHSSALVLTSGTSRDLRHQLESTLVRTEVGIVQHGIRIQYSNDTYMVEVQSLGYHLRPDEYVRLSLFKVRDNLLVGGTGTGRIQVHPCYGSFREKDFNIIFNLFRTKTAVYQFRPFTSGTSLRKLVGISAIVAGQLIDSFMIGKAYITVLTLRHPTAGTTFYHRSKTTTVLKKNHLFLLLQGFFHILYQKR